RELVPSEQNLLRRLVGEATREGPSSEELGDLDISVAPVVRVGGEGGGIVLASRTSEDAIYSIFLRSTLEAAAIAALFGGLLMLLLATLLGGRVKRLARGAKAIERGDLSQRITPGFGDELGDLAKTFNDMAANLEAVFLRLEEKNTRLNRILDTLTEGVMLTDDRGRPVFANRAAHAMLALDGWSISHIPDPWEEFSLPEAITHCLSDRGPLEARVEGRDSFLNVQLRRLSAENDSEGGALVVLQDLSEGRRLEANQQRFLANASHEIKTPITSILGAAELLLSGDQEDPEVRQMFLENIHDEAERLRRLSQTLLRLARTGQDLREPELRAVDLAGTVRRGAQRMETLAREAGMELHVEDREAWVLADEEWLDQAVIILLNNAIQHSRRAGRIRVCSGGLTLTVEDEGIGIKESDLPHVFERFYRTASAPEGFGLGLPLCKELIERMAGSISLRSREGEGTVVKIELPEAKSVPKNPDSRR
ncbi:MAG: ATP-binding protein, partial [Rubrobacter sp.]